MNQINDPKLEFYFKNQQMIDEWASLAAQVPAVCHSFLCSMEPDVRALAVTLGATPHINTEADYSKLFLTKSNWLRNETRAAIGLEWFKSSVSFRKNRSTYIGVWVYHSQPDGPKLSKDLQQKFAKDGLLTGLSSNNWWPAHRFEGASYDNFWENLQPYRDSLLESIKFFWSRFATAIDQTV